MDSNDCEVYLYKGIILKNLGRIQKAIEMFDESLLIIDFMHRVFNKGLIFHSKKQLDHARMMCFNALQRNHHYVDTICHQAKLLFRFKGLFKFQITIDSGFRVRSLKLGSQLSARFFTLSFGKFDESQPINVVFINFFLLTFPLCQKPDRSLISLISLIQILHSPQYMRSTFDIINIGLISSSLFLFNPIKNYKFFIKFTFYPWRIVIFRNFRS